MRVRVFNKDILMNVDQRHPSACGLRRYVCSLVAIAGLLGAFSLFSLNAAAAPSRSLSLLPSLVLGDTGNPSPAPISSFTGIDPANSTPPDSHGAVNSTHVVTHINGQAIIQDRTGTILANVGLTTFWGSLGVTDVFDPKVIFDPHSNRFMAMACAQRRSSSSGMLFGVSATSDPTGTWHLWLLDADASNVNWVDFPNIGLTANTVTLTGNLFSNSADAFGGVNIWVLSKSTVLDGGAFTQQLLKVTNAGGTLVPALTYDATETTQYLVRVGSSNLFGSGRLQVYSLTGSVGSITFNTIPFASIGPAWSISLPNAKQLGSTATIETNDDRLMNAVIRNGRMWTVHNVAFDTTTRDHSAVKWWELTPSDGTVIQSGLIEDVGADGLFDNTTGRYYYYPSIAVNKNNEMLVGFSGSGALEYASNYYAYRSPSYAAGLTDTPFKYKAGLGVYSGPRWGDYSATVVDPTDDTTFWTVQQFAAGGNKGANYWAQVGKASSADTTAPRVTGATALTSTTVRITFDEAMLDGTTLTTASSYTFTGGLTASSVTRLSATQVSVTVNEMVSGTSYTATVSTSGPSDLAGNRVSGAANTATFTGLGGAPTALISLDNPNPTNLNTVNFSVDFSESVGTSFTAADVSVTGSLSTSASAAVSGGPIQFTVAVTPSNPNAEGTIGISVGTGITDLVGNTFGGGTSPQAYTIDNTAPAIGVTAKTTTDRTPSLAGTVSDNTATISVVVAGQTRTATNNGNGTWTLADNSLTSIADGTYNVVATATDPAGNAGTDGTTNELIVDGTAPTVTVNSRVTNDNTPQLTGTVSETGATVTVVVGGQTRTATNNGNGTWTLPDGSLTALADGVYNVAATATDGVGNMGTDGTTNELTVDATAPVLTVNALITKDTTPALSGTTSDLTAAVSLTVSGQTRAATNNGNGTWTLADNSLTALAAGVYNVAVTSTDAAGNTGNDASSNELTIDTTAPVVTVNTLTTNDTTPPLTGTVNDQSATISVTVGGQTRAATNNANGTWTLANGSLTALAQGTYNVAVTATDQAGNAASDGTTNELIIDTVAPTITVATRVTNDTTPPLNGTVNDATATISVTVNGQTRTATNNGATWTLADGSLTAIPAGTYDVVATATDAAGNVGTESTTGELTIDTAAPTVTVNSLNTTDATPSLTGTVNDNAAAIRISVGGQSNVAATNNGNGTWTLADNTLTTLADGTYDVAATATDTAGNAGADGTNNELVVDSTAPVVTVNTLVTNDARPPLSGTVNDTTATISVVVGGQTRAATNNGNGTWTLANDLINPVLPQGTYNVAVTATDSAGNAGTDSTASELTIDTTAPTITVTARTTNDTTPSLSGTVNDTTATISVVVSGQTRTATNNGNGTWTLADGSLTALVAGTYNVAATATDAAGNAGVDGTTNELVIDVTAPTITVNSLTTNDSTPPLSGTINDTTATVSVTVSGQTRAATNNGNGTWTLANGSLSALGNGVFNVVATATDAAGNAGTDATNNELTVDTIVPSITVNTLSTTDTTPALSGTVSETGATISVVVSGQTRAATNNGNGTWTLADNSLTALPNGVFNVVATATDAAGNVGADGTTNELTVDNTPPLVTVNALNTNDAQPQLTGTVNENSATIRVSVGGQLNLVAVNNANGTWTLADNTINPALAAGTYNVSVTATDTLGNAGSDATTNELVIDLTAPVVGVNSLTTNDNRPELSGTVNDNTATISVSVGGQTLAATNNANGTWTLANDAINPALAQGTYNVSVTATDLAGNAGADATNNELRVDTTAPTVTVATLVTNDNRPPLSGTVNDTTATIRVDVGGQTNLVATNNGNGTWALADNTISPALASGIYNVVVRATDAASNVGTDATTNELTIDTSAPTVTVNTLSTADNTPALTGTVSEAGATISVTVSGQTNAATNNGNGTWTLANNTLAALPDGTYNVAATATDAAGNAGSDATTNELRVDTTAPTVTVNTLTTNDTTPPLSGTVNDASATISVTVGGQTRTATNNGATWTLANNTISPALAAGTYDVAVTATDAVGNAGTDATAGELVVDTTAPTITVTARTTNDTTPALSGTVNDAAATINITVNGSTYPATNNGATWTLNNDVITPALTAGTFSVTATATDTAGNTGTDGTANELVIDLVAPTITVDTLTTNDTRPPLTGTVNDNSATISVVVGGQTRTATNNANGTWTLANDAINPALAAGTYDVLATATDTAGNAGTDSTSGELILDTTAPVITVNALVTNDNRPPLTGTVNDTAATISVIVGGQTRTGTNNGDGTWTLANDVINPALADGTYFVTATATDSAGNAGVDGTTNELRVDTVAPTITVNTLVTADSTPALTGTVNDNAAVITVVVSGQTLTATNNANGTWTLANNLLTALPDGTYSVAATARDTANNSRTDSTSNELRIDTTGPVVTVNTLVTRDNRPPLSGTIDDPTATISVTVGGQTRAATNNANGTWTLANDLINPALADNTYDVAVTATDSVSNTGNDGSTGELRIDTTLNVTVTALTTSDNRPALSGTVDDTTATISVVVNGSTYPATNNGNGTWTLADNAITPALPDATYNVAVTATDSLGNVATDGTTNELVINGSVPTVTVNALTTSNNRPALSGSVSTPAATILVDVGGQTNLAATNNGNGTWTLAANTINPGLADGTYDVQVRATTSGTGTDSTSNELVIDTAAPVVTVNARSTNDQRPAMSGTVNDPAAVIRLTVSVHSNLVVTNNGDGTWTLADNIIPANLAAGTYNVAVTATDAAGNAGTDATSNELVIDLTAPTITVNTLLTKDNTPALSGTINDNTATVSVTVNGQTRAAVNGGAGTWTLADNSLTPLADGVYPVVATATDTAGNSANDGSTNELTVDTAAPTVTVNTLTTADSTPALTGMVNDNAATISVVVGGQTRAATNNGNGTWTLADNTINPALTDGTYNVAVTATDTATNAGTDSTTNELRIDTTAPTITVNNLSTNDRRPPLTGTVNDNTATISITVGGQTRAATNNGNGTWTLADNLISPNLADNTYNVAATATDSLGNAGNDATTNELVIDATAPTITVNTLTTNDNRPALTGTTNDNTATISVTVGGQTRTATNNANGTWTLADNAINPALTDGTYEVVARATDTFNNSRNDSSANELRIDTVVPVVAVNTLTTNDNRPPLTGTVNDTTATIRVSVGGQSNLAATNNGNGTWTLANDTINPALASNTYDVVVTATDAAGNAGADATTSELVVDTVAPTITVTVLTTRDTTPALTGTVNDNGATIRVSVGGQSNLLAVNNGNGTWTLPDNTLTPLAGGVFSVAATATDAAGNVGTEATVNELTIDTNAPTVTVDTLATSDNRPPLSGTVNDNAATINILVGGQTRAATNNGDGTWTLANDSLAVLADGTYDVRATATDDQGNAGTDSSTAELRIDTTAPTVTVNTLTTADNRPQLTGTVNDISATVSITVNALTFGATNNGNGTWTLADNAITPALADGTYNVTATATDTLGNAASDGSTNELRILTAAPVITVNAITTNDTTPAMTGTVNDNAATITVQVNGITFPATNNANGTWTLANNTITPALAEGVYSVIARATNAAAVTGQDSTNNELTIDVTAPVVAIATRFTQDTRPAVSGTVNTANATIRVDVGGQTNRVAVNNGDGTWTLPDDTINPALAQGSYNVVVRATDTAGNVGTDATTNELHVDNTVPVVTVTALSTNDNTPGLSGTVTDNIAAGTVAVSVTVNGQTRAAVVTAGAWIVANGSLTTIPDGVYDVSVTATDQAGNVGNDATNNELRVDTTAPTVTVSSLNTNDRTPPLSGTVNDNSAAIRVSVGGQTNVVAVNNANGTWTLPNNTLTTLSDGVYNVAVTATDTVGNSGSDATADELRIDGTAPVITVNTRLTNDSTPALSGTVNDSAATISVVVNGNTYPATNNGNGTWSLADGTIAPALPTGTYNVAATATDTFGNVGTDATTSELVVDLVAPAITVATLLTNDASPPLTGTVDDPAATITVTIGGQADVPATNNGDGTWMLPDGALNPLADGVYSVVARATDAAGNSAVDGTANELTVNSQAPTITVTSLVTNDRTPALSGTVDDPAATITVTVGSQTGLAATNGGAGTWTLADNTLTSLSDGVYNVIVTAVDLQSNSASDTTTDELRIDATAPVVTVASLLTNDNRPALSGTVDDTTATVRVAVNGETNLVAVNNGDGTWSLPNDTIVGALPDNAVGYDVIVTATDTLGNAASDTTTAELRVDTTAPTAGINAVATKEASPSITGTTNDSSASIRVTVNGETVDATNNSNGTWTLPGDVLTPLASGTYAIAATATDPAGNVGSANLPGGLLVDVTAPVIGVNTLVTTDTTPALTGTVDDTAAVILVTVAGQSQNATNNGNGTWTLADNTLTALVDGLYDVTATATDSLGNVGGESTTNELRIDTSGPVVTINRLVTNDSTPRITGTVDEAGIAINVTVEGNTYAAVNNGDGTWTLADNSIAPALGAGTYDLMAVASDGLGNAGADTTSDELTIDLTVPVVTVATSLTPLASPNLNGAIDDIFATVTVTVGGQTRTATNIGNGTWVLVSGALDPLPSGVYDVVVEARDTAGNIATDATTDELTVDLGVPVVTVDELATNDNTPPLSGTVDDPTATVTVTVAGQSVIATNNGDGTWSIADNVLTTLADGSYNVIAVAEDAAGNAGTDPTQADDLIVLTAPPIVTVIAQVTGDSTPQVNGLINQTTSSVTVTVDGQTHVATNNGDGTWSLADNTLTPLAEGTYNVQAEAVDLLGNTGTDGTTNELTINLDAALITVNRLSTRDRTPALSGTVSAPGIGILISVGGQTHSATNNDDGTWTLANDTLSPLDEGTYDVAAEALGVVTSTDSTVNELKIDTLGPSVEISGPSVSATQSGPVSFNIHYGPDAKVGLLLSDVATFALQQSNVTTVLDPKSIASTNNAFPISTATAKGTLSISGTGNSVRTVTVSDITGNGYLGVAVIGGSAVDSSGNPADSAIAIDLVNVDNTAPKLLNGGVANQGILVIAYDEAMSDTALDPKNYTISGSGQGTLAAKPDLVVRTAPDRFRLVWSTGAAVNGEEIVVTVLNVTDAVTNLIGADNSVTIAIEGLGVAPTVTDFQVTGAQSATIRFSEPVALGATEPNSYALSGSGRGTLAAQPASVELLTDVPEEAGQPEIVVPPNTYQLTWNGGEMLQGGDLTITVSGVEDNSGDLVTTPNSATDAGAGIGVAPTVQLADVITGLTVNVGFSEPMGAGALVAANYSLSGAGRGTLAANPDAVVEVSPGLYRLTWTTGEMVNGRDITITASGVTDEAGNPLGTPNSATDVKAGRDGLITVNIVSRRAGTLYEDAEGDVASGAGALLLTGTTADGGIRRGLMQFDVSGNIPAGSTISDAVLVLTNPGAPGDSTARDVGLHRVERDWNQGESDAGDAVLDGAAAVDGDVTWLHTDFNTEFWTAPGGDFAAGASATASVAGAGVYTWDTPGLAADAQNWLDDPANNFGWIAIGDEGSAGTVKPFYSDERVTVSERPVLQVVYSLNGGAGGPVLGTIGDQESAEGETISIDVTAVDSGANPLVLSASLTTLPEGNDAQFTDNGDGTATFTWTPSFEDSGSYVVTFIATQSGVTPPLSIAETVVIEVAELNQAPELADPGVLDATEGVLFQFTPTLTDNDAGDTHSYSLAASQGDASVDPTTGVLTWTPGFSDAGNFNIGIVVTDNGAPQLSDVLTLQVRVSDANGAPALAPIGPQVVVEAENLAFTASATDPDLDDTLAFSLEDGPAGSSIDAVTGQFRWTPNIIAAGVYDVTVVVTDSGTPPQRDSETISITVVDDNQNPTNISLTPSSVAENLPTGTAVGLLSTTDLDVGDVHTYAFATGQGDGDNGLFTIAGNEVRTGTPLNYEARSSYSIRVQTEDGKDGVFGKSLTVTVVNANDLPQSITLSNNVVVENAALRSTIGAFSTADEDRTGVHTYALVEGEGATGNELFAINGNALVTNGTIDYEAQTGHSVRVRSTDPAGAFVEAIFGIVVENTNDSPSGFNLTGGVIAENQPVGTLVGAFETADDDFEDDHVYTLVAGDGSTDNGQFSIDGAELRSASVLDFEKGRMLSIRVRVSDGQSLNLESVFAVEVTDTNDAPADLVVTPTGILDNVPADTTVARLFATDQDVGDTHTFSLVTGEGATNNALFKISGNSLATSQFLAFDASARFNVRLRATDAAGASVEKAIVLTNDDTDGDGLSDAWEREYFGNLNNGAGDDNDGDGLLNRDEFMAGTNPAKSDTDGDGASDGLEVSLGTNPLNAQDAPAVLRVTPGSLSASREAGELRLTVRNTGLAPLNWQAEVVSGDFVTIESGQSGVNTGSIHLNVEENLGTTGRSATIRVTAPNAAGSPLEIALTQDACTTPGVADDVLATNGTLPGQVRVTWDRVPGADQYEVFRGLVNEPEEADRLATVTGTAFTDNTAEVLDGKQQQDSGCFLRPDPQADTYLYWVRAISVCGTGAFSTPNDGYPGAGEPPARELFEPVLPTLETENRTLTARANSALAIRLRRDTAIDPSSVQGLVEFEGGSSTDVDWLAIDTVGLRDGLALYVPSEGEFVEGDTVIFTVNASTLTGETIGPLSYSFTIETEEFFLERLGASEEAIFQPTYSDFDSSGINTNLEGNEQVSVYTLATSPAPLAGGTGETYAIVPDEAYPLRQRVWIPLEDGVEASDVAPYYYYVDKAGNENGWRTAADIKGWLVEDSILELELNGVRYVGFLVRHGAVVRMGPAAGKSEVVSGASALPLEAIFGARSGDGVVMAVLMLMLLVVLPRVSRRWATRPRW